MPEPSRSRSVDATKSVPNWASSASTYTPVSAQLGAPGSNSANTTAGPDRVPAAREREQRALGMHPAEPISGSAPSSEPAATSAGTASGGSRNSIGTNTSCVGLT